MDERDVETSCSFANTTGSESDALTLKMTNAGFQVVHPQTKMVQRWYMHFGCLVLVDRLHEINLHSKRPNAKLQNVFVDILTLLSRRQHAKMYNRKPNCCQPKNTP